jgi:hypothetical protein
LAVEYCDDYAGISDAIDLKALICNELNIQNLGILGGAVEGELNYLASGLKLYTSGLCGVVVSNDDAVDRDGLTVSDLAVSI